MNSPQRSHQLSCVWLQGWKSCPHPGLHVSQSGSSRRTRSPTIRTTFSLLHLSRVGVARGGGPLEGANSMRSSGVKSCSSISSHFAILGTQEAEKHGSVGHDSWEMIYNFRPHQSDPVYVKPGRQTSGLVLMCLHIQAQNRHGSLCRSYSLNIKEMMVV